MSNYVSFERNAQFYGCSTWKRFKVTVMRRFEAAYVKCIKSFFGFEHRYSVTKMFCYLGLPTFNTVMHNAQVRLDSSVDIHNNELVKHYFIFGNFSMLYVVCLLCLSVYLSFFTVSLVPVV